MTFEVGKTYRTKGGWLAKVIPNEREMYPKEITLKHGKRYFTHSADGQVHGFIGKDYDLTTEEIIDDQKKA